MNTKRLALTGTALAAVLLLSACGGSTEATNTGATTSAETADSTHSTASVVIDGQWAKAAEAGGMTGLFGTLHNNSDSDLTISGVENSAAEMTELHEVTADGRMQQIKGDVVIPADGIFELAPGANHIMLMGLMKPLLAGDDVTVTVHFDDGTSLEIKAPVKDYAGANESYDDLGEHGEHEAETADGHGGH